MTYDKLTDDQKKNIAYYDGFLRGLFAGLAKISKESSADSWNQFAVANIDDVLAELDNDASIPNSTGYAGAVALTKIEFLTLQGIARALQETKTKNLPLLVKTVGING